MQRQVSQWSSHRTNVPRWSWPGASNAMVSSLTMRPYRRSGTYHWQYSRLEQHTCFQFLLFLLHLQDLLLQLLQDEGRAEVEDEGGEILLHLQLHLLLLEGEDEDILLRLQLQLLHLQLHLLLLLEGEDEDILLRLQLQLLHLQLHLLLLEDEDEDEHEAEEEAKGARF